nr:cathepsin L1 [Halyomorpha halys]
MPDISSYVKINDKNYRETIVEVNDPKSDCICRKGVFRYGMFLLAWLAVGIFLFCITLTLRSSDHRNEGFDKMWEFYKIGYGKNYSQKEDDVRMSIFIENLKEMDRHNILKLELTPEELDEITGFQGTTEHLPAIDAFFNGKDIAYPESFDWRLKGAVTGVKNQDRCGSCYAFSATGSLEAQHFLKTGQLVSLSEQNLVDCSRPQGNNGCHGGNMNNAFHYILQNYGIDTEQSYPYEGEEGPCRFQKGGVGATLRGYRSLVPSEAALQAAVVDIGPISVGIHATVNLSKYKGGIFDDDSCNPFALNHAVLVVGYGSEGGQDYWIVKNSWSSIWGENGYFRIVRNKGNKCGIASMASYPVV